MIRRWQPWERSTGPRTVKGKARASLNAYKGGKREETRTLMRAFNQLVRQQGEWLKRMR